MTDAERTVLVADTDADAVAEYRSWLTGEYRVETTTDGTDALARLEAVDVALIGRGLRTADGTVVARAVERRGEGYAMAVLRGDDESERDRTAAVALTEPVSNAALCETVDRLLRRVRYDELMDECAALAAGDAPEDTGTGIDRDVSEADRLEELLAAVDALRDGFDGEDFRAAFGTCTYGESARAEGVRERS
ncbi:HoxA-like transcriptional regulator [Natrinema saccharevitans]|uniref:HoxA-like transcriptional regulator n=1 Tax=Natrinema saccharevitans TaxID=301967 RepID=A0A1S8AWM9_9EURY|nr:response regulator transcription factor [Natrinema saccharevitans]OLZ41105.1 HoxA-like transcriptional regulator [Natrinema saccharevitans]